MRCASCTRSTSLSQEIATFVAIVMVTVIGIVIAIGIALVVVPSYGVRELQVLGIVNSTSNSIAYSICGIYGLCELQVLEEPSYSYS